MNGSIIASKSDVHDTGYSIHAIGGQDIKLALQRGLDDFRAFPSHGVFLCVIYPVIGLILSRLVFGYDIVRLLFPLAAGFALIGPFAAFGLYELSRRRQAGLDSTATDALGVFKRPGAGSLLILGVVLAAIFVLWIIAADTIYGWSYGNEGPASIAAFIVDVLTTSRGWQLIIVGNLVGFLFSAVVLAISVVSFPLIVDRNAGPLEAVRVSLNAVMNSPATYAQWGIVVAVGLLLGSIPLFAGLPFIIPVLGHATWHLYRQAIA